MKKFTDLLSPEAWATYIIGLSAIFVGVYQFKRTFKLNKKSAVFDELSKEIEEAIELVSGITNSTNNVITQLSNAANSASFDPVGKTQAEQTAEIERRIKELGEIADKQRAYLESIYDSYKKILTIIKKIEKSSVVSDKSREAARYLFLEATEQHNFVTTVRDIIQSFNVTPPLGQTPNISPETFNTFAQLVQQINSRNQIIGNYLSDLDSILHNNLVKNLYGKSKIETIPTKHLTSNGLVDTRVKRSLL